MSLACTSTPPKGEVVVPVDAKTGVQALDRTQPLLLVSFGKAEKHTGTIETHTSADFLRLINKVTATNSGKKIHVILDNASSHTSEEVERWLGKQGGGAVFHFTPKGASWLNMIEVWNGIVTRKSIRRIRQKTVPLSIQPIREPG